jgi:DNA-binding IclR family transcriptional regulator
MNAEPGRAWTGQELAQRLQVKPRNMLTQLAEWSRLGFLTRTAAGTYTLRHAVIDAGPP